MGKVGKNGNIGKRDKEGFCDCCTGDSISYHERLCFADNKSWGDMTYEEKQAVKQEFAEIKEELEEEFSSDSIEDGLASYILDAVSAVIENAD